MKDSLIKWRVSLDGDHYIIASDPESIETWGPKTGTDPIEDNSVPGIPHAPPAMPYPAKVPPKSSMPKEDKGPYINSTDDDTNTEYLGASASMVDQNQCPVCGKPMVRQCRCSNHTMAAIRDGHGKKCADGHRWSFDKNNHLLCPELATVQASKLGSHQPKDHDMLEREKRASNPPQSQIRNQDGSSIAPNPDLDTAPPGGGPDSVQWMLGKLGQFDDKIVTPKQQDVDSFDDGAPEPIKDKPSFVGDAGYRLEVDEQGVYHIIKHITQ